MIVIGPILRLAGTTLLVVAVVGCGGLDRTNRDADPGSGANGLESIGALEAELGADAENADEAFSGDLDGLVDAVGTLDLDFDFDLGLADGADAAGAEPASSPTGPGAPTTGLPLPTFDAGSFADLDAALSTLDLAIGAGAAGPEGNLP